MTPQEVLLAAADLIERDGWVRGTSFVTINGTLHHCVISAIYDVTPGPGGPALDRLIDYLGVPSVADWNDAQKDKRTVVRALRRAARS